MLSRKITAESDSIMDQVNAKEMTAEDARKWLSRVVQVEHEKIEQLQLLRRVDSLSPADDARHDAAMAAAWKHVAETALNDPGHSISDDLIKSNVELIRRDLASEARRRIICRDYRDLTGHEGTIAALDYAKIANLWISGKRAAWERHPDALHAIEEVADTLAKNVTSFLEVSEPPSPKAENPAPVEDTGLDPSITAVVERMNAIKREDGIEEKTLRQYQSFASLFTLLTGIQKVSEIRQSHVTSFRSAVYQIPKSWGKSPKDSTASREQIMAKAATLPAEKVGLSVGTINRHLEHLGQIAEWADGEGIAVDRRLNPGKLKRKETVRARDKRDAFSEEQLVTLFDSPVWKGSYSERFQTRSGPKIYRNGIFWCPLIGAVTGARREEIAGLAPSDIIDVDGIMCFSIEDSEIRRVKNLSSVRLVPIHSSLINLGFLEHVAKARSSKKRYLFPDLSQQSKGNLGRKVGRRMRDIVDETLGLDGAKLTFHSLRHYVQNALENCEVDEGIVRDLVGHEGKDTHERVYRKASPMAKLRDAIELLRGFPE
ncbi:site-specific integrase [Pseudooceanicola spongiae]|nr:site-specific integrase [Pseudooceanicola spongiae]